jgi:hypothetical protein
MSEVPESRRVGVETEQPGADGTSTDSTRRDFLGRAGLLAVSGLGAATVGGLLPAVGSAATEDQPESSALQQLAENAVIFGSPLVLYDNWRQLWKREGFAFNKLYANTVLATPEAGGIGPNVDTLYGYVWFDLTRGPVLVQVPATGDRYYSWMLEDMWGHVFTYIGTRVTGNEAGTYALVPPGWQGKLPRGIGAIKAPTNYVDCIVRTLVRSPADLPAARKVIESYRVGPLKTYPHGLAGPASGARAESINLRPEGKLTLAPLGLRIYEEINQGILRFPPPLPPEAREAKTFRPVGIDMAKYQRPSGDLAMTLEAAIPPALAAGAAATKAFSTEVNGWTVDYGLVPFEHNPLKRLSTAYYGGGTNVNQEAIYFNTTTYRGAPLLGSSTYELVFPSGLQPPVDAFWSVIIYQASNLGLVPNPIDRYEVASHTPGLVTRADGSLSITVGAAQPSDPTTNWLPAPAGNFILFIRAYLPKPALLNRRWLPPSLQKL